MGIFETFLTMRLTHIAIEKVNEASSKETSTGECRQTKVLNPLFWVCLVVFTGFAYWAFCTNEIGAALFFLAFAMVPASVLISIKTCWIKFDETGFIRSNFFGVKRQYIYDDIEAVGNRFGLLHILLKNGKKIKLNQTWENTKGFYKTICSSGKSFKDLDMLPELMKEDLISAYKTSDMKSIMDVKRNDISLYKKHKIVSNMILIGTVGAFLLGFFGGVYILAEMAFLIVLSFLVASVASIVYLIMYFKHPELYTMRPAPDKRYMQNIKNHKIETPMAMMFFSGFLNMIAGLLFKTGLSLQIISVIAVVTYIVGMKYFKNHSEEYKKYKAGFVTFGMAFFMYIAGWVFIFT